MFKPSRSAHEVSCTVVRLQMMYLTVTHTNISALAVRKNGSRTMVHLTLSFSWVEWYHPKRIDALRTDFSVSSLYVQTNMLSICRCGGYCPCQISKKQFFKDIQHTLLHAEANTKKFA